MITTTTMISISVKPDSARLSLIPAPAPFASAFGSPVAARSRVRAAIAFMIVLALQVRR